jgi:hypothetical protein
MTPRTCGCVDKIKKVKNMFWREVQTTTKPVISRTTPLVISPKTRVDDSSYLLCVHKEN